MSRLLIVSMAGFACAAMTWWGRYWAGAYVVCAQRAAAYRPPRHAWRTPALTERVQHLHLDPCASARLRGPMLQRARIGE